MVYYPPGAEVHPGDEFQASDQEIIDFLVRFKQIYYMPPHLWLKSGCGNGQGKEWNIPLQQQKLIDELENVVNHLKKRYINYPIIIIIIDVLVLHAVVILIYIMLNSCIFNIYLI